MPLLLRALRWRAAASVATALLAAATVLGVVIGPLWTRAGSESLLRDRLTQTDPSVSAAFYDANGVPGTDGLAALDTADKLSPLSHYGKAVHGLKLNSLVSLDGKHFFLQQLLWREDVCAQVVLISGRCPTKPHEVLLPRQTATAMHLTTQTALPGTVLQLGASVPSLPVTETIVGVYSPKDLTSTYWTGEADTDFYFGPSPKDEGPTFAPPELTDAATFDAIAATYPTSPVPQGSSTLTRLLDGSSVRLRDVKGVRASIAAAVTATDAASTPAQVTTLRDAATDEFDAAARDGSSLRRASTVVLAQLVLLAGVVLLLVVSSSAASRAPEVAAARLRGLRTRTVLSLAVGEPLLLVAAGTPVGGLLAYVVARLMVADRLVDGTPLEVTGGAVLTLVIAFAVLVLAVLLTCARELGKPVLELWQRTDKPPSRSALVLELVGAVALAGGAYACSQGGEPWVLLTPVPVSLAIALVGLRVLPLLFAPSLRRTRGRRRLTGFLAVRQLVRRREGAFLTGLLVVAFGLAVTATTASSVENRAASVRANAEVGAPVVLTVQPDPSHLTLNVDLRAAVRAADPQGTEAMAVLEYLPFSSDPGGRLLAVDSSRLERVAIWDRTLSGTTVEDVKKSLQGKASQLPQAVVTKRVADAPPPPGAVNLPANGTVVTGVDARRLVVHVDRVVSSLPRGLTSSTMVDWDAIAQVPPEGYAALEEVWMTHSDPALVKRLAADGLQVVATDVTSQHRALLKRQGPALAVLLSLVAAGFALVLAAATTLFSVLTSARRRGWENAALAALGVPRGTLRRASRLESLLLLGAGLGFGAIAGAVACLVTIPSLPLFSDDIGITVPLTPRPVPLLVLAAIAVVLVAGTAGLVGRVLQRAADPARLREVQA